MRFLYVDKRGLSIKIIVKINIFRPVPNDIDQTKIFTWEMCICFGKLGLIRYSVK